MEEEKKTRDRLGRWVKGVSGNAEGRRPKSARVESADFLTFKNSLIEVNTPDGPVMMTREAAVLHRLYQSAMKGNVHAQIHLSRRFDRYYESLGVIAAEMNRIISEIHEQGRPMADYERGLIEQALKHLNAQPFTHDEMPKVSLRRTRVRKPKRKEGKSDSDNAS